MESNTPPAQSAGSTETLNETDSKGSFGENLDQQRSLVRQKEDELKAMQDQIESYNQMVKHLASQREMAVKKLNDMDTQINELSKMLETERLQVEAKDKELETKRSQLQALKFEEDDLKGKFDSHKKELSATTENLSTAQLHESKIKTKLMELQQFLTTTNEAIDDIEEAISIKDTIKLSALCNQMLTPPPLSINSLLTNGLNSSTSPLDQSSQDNQTPSRENNFSNTMFENEANFDPFANDDPFDGDDPFKSIETNIALPEDDPFNPSSTNSGGFSALQNDPFLPSRDGF